MPLVPRNALPAKISGSSKEHSMPNEKENELPSTTATVRKCKRVGLRRRVSLCSNDDRRKESIAASGRPGPAIGETFSSRKTRFHVHCDEKNVPESQPQPQLQPHPQPQPQPQPQPSAASSHEHRNERKQPAAPGFKEKGRVSRKPLADTEPRRNENVLPSKIPRRARSASNSSNARKARSRDDENGPSLQTISNAPTSSKAVEGVNAARRAITDRTYRVDRILASSTLQLNRIDSIGSIDRRARSKDRREESSPTPTSVRSREPFVVDHGETPKQPARIEATKALISLPGALNCNAEYHTDLPIVEREKEELAPRLSANFLEGHVNADQRKVIVVYMFHLGTHCRYPSPVVYRAVKLFDATIDRLQVDTVLIQLTALACLWIALKTLENSHRIPTASTMVSLAKDLYAGREDLLIDYEKKILRTLDFNVTFADAYSLLSYHLINLKRCATISNEMFMFVYYAGCYAIDVTLIDDRFCRTSASLVTITAAELVLGLFLDTEQARATDRSADCQIRPRWLFWRGFLCAAAAAATATDRAAGSRFGDRFQDEEIDRCRVAMLRCVLNSGRKKYGFEVVYKKYSRSRFGRIAESFLDRAGMLSPLETFDP